MDFRIPFHFGPNVTQVRSAGFEQILDAACAAVVAVFSTLALHADRLQAGIRLDSLCLCRERWLARSVTHGGRDLRGACSGQAVEPFQDEIERHQVDDVGEEDDDHQLGRQLAAQHVVRGQTRAEQFAPEAEHEHVAVLDRVRGRQPVAHAEEPHEDTD